MVASNNNSCGTASAISFTATTGTTYYFAVRGVLFTNHGPGVFNFQFIADGDTCAIAIEVTTNGSFIFDTTGASPDDPCAAIPTVWYRFTAPSKGTVNADLCGSSFDTWLTVWTGPTCPDSCDDRIQSDNYACGLASAVSFDVTAGTTYHFSVSGTLPSSFGPGVFNFEFVAQPGDNCDLAVEITTNGSYPFNTTGASGDDPCLAGIPTVWYRFTAPTNGLVSADLCGSSFDTYLTAFAGEACPASCTGIAAENDDSCGTASAISFAATAGTTYYFAVSGSEESDFGSGVFNFHFLPPGDTCGDAIEVASGSSTPFDLTVMNGGDDPCFSPEFRTLWFRYTAPANGVMTADTCGSSFNTFLQGFVSSGCPVLCEDRVASNSNSCELQSLVSFNMEQGQTAYFVVGGFSAGAAGPGVFNLTFAPTQAGLFCDTAGVLTGNGTYAFETTDAPDRDPCFPSARAVWYRFTAPDHGSVSVDLCGSPFNTRLTIFSTQACPAPCGNALMSNDNSCGQQSALYLDVTAGQSILICVAGNSAIDFGPGVMNFSFVPGSPPPLLGDVNGDGVVNVADVTALSNWLRSDKENPIGPADVNGDGFVNELDVQALAEMIVE